MRILQVRGVEEAYEEALWAMHLFGDDQPTRNGLAKVAPYPVVTVYSRPIERMLYNVKRDANPFFHVVEAMWMLAGRNDVKTLVEFARQLGEYSDDGATLNGAYGFRWRNYFEVDQLLEIIQLLKADPNTRRAVLAMWDGAEDLTNTTKSKDVPCNTHIYFQIRDGTLEMTVCNRSNDIVWGCYGANVVHMSFLQEFISLAVGVRMGKYYQFSNNWHIYEQHFNLLGVVPRNLPTHYDTPDWLHVRLLDSNGDAPWFLTSVENFIHNMNNHGPFTYNNAFLDHVMTPLVISWRFHKMGYTDMAVNAAGQIRDTAIRAACQAWLIRRLK